MSLAAKRWLLVIAAMWIGIGFCSIPIILFKLLGVAIMILALVSGVIHMVWYGN